MSRRYYANAAPQRTLSANINGTATSLTVSGTFSGWPSSCPYFAVLEYGTSQMEIVSVTNVVGSTATIVRGQDGTSAVSHSAGATLDFAFVAKDMDEANAHVNATSGVHGLTGAPVGTTDTQTLTNKTLTSPTVNGATVTGTVTASSATVNSPTINNPTLTGTMTGAGGINVGGSITSGNSVTASAGSFSGVVGVAGLSVSGNGTVSGVVVPKTYTNEAAASSAIPSPATGAVVYLSAPTGSAPGLYYWNGSAWVPSSAAFGITLADKGSTSITPSGVNVVTSATVSFNKTFPSPPTYVGLQFVTGVTGTVSCEVWPTSITTTGFTLNINRSSTTATSVLWWAVL